MRWVLFAAVLVLLLVFPGIWTMAIAGAAWVVSQPVAVAFALGVAARPHLPKLRWWKP